MEWRMIMTQMKTKTTLKDILLMIYCGCNFLYHLFIISLGMVGVLVVGHSISQHSISPELMLIISIVSLIAMPYGVKGINKVFKRARKWGIA